VVRSPSVENALPVFEDDYHIMGYIPQSRLHRTRSSHNFPTYLQEDALVFDCVFIGLYSDSNLRTGAKSVIYDCLVVSYYSI